MVKSLKLINSYLCTCHDERRHDKTPYACSFICIESTYFSKHNYDTMLAIKTYLE